MNDLVLRYGDWAFIAGAAEGIGAAFSIALAEKGMNLILVDNNFPALNLLADELEKNFRISTLRIFQDLTKPDAVSACLEKSKSIDFRLVVYVPAFSPVGRFSSYTDEDIDRFLSLNNRTPIHFIHSLLKKRQKDKQYGIIMMSSLAGILGPPLSAPYAGTKAFTVVLAESLFYELKDAKVDIMACCAGPTSTPTYWSSNPGKQNKIIDVMQPSKVAVYALKMLGKRSYCIPGWKNRLFYYILTRILPRKMAGNIVSKSIKKMYPDL
ncbi:MAG: SDR family NAD(P)-dependent oxidoreductase [Bacteroidales bacterium]|jgi:short-subunit dehydrogenase